MYRSRNLEARVSKQFRWCQLRNKFRVIEQGDAIGRHGVDRWCLDVIESQYALTV
jgi:hypothetical protein